MQKLPTEFESPDNSPGYQLWRVTNLWQSQIRRALKPFDLTHVQFVLLTVSTHLTEHGLPVNQARIADAAGTDKMMTSQVLRSLESKSLVVRTQSAEDGRAVDVMPTFEGRSLASKAVVQIEMADAAFFSVLGSDAVLIGSLLHRLAASHAKTMDA